MARNKQTQTGEEEQEVPVLTGELQLTYTVRDIREDVDEAETIWVEQWSDMAELMANTKAPFRIGNDWELLEQRGWHEFPVNTVGKTKLHRFAIETL